MKPTTKRQKEIATLSVPSLSDKQRKLGILHSFTSKERSHKNNLKRYFVLSSRIKNFQLVRFFLIRKSRQEYIVLEPMRLWFDDNANIEVEAMNRVPFIYIDSWITSSERSFKHVPESYKDYTVMLPITYSKITSCIPVLKRNGLKSSFHNVQPRDVIEGLIKNNKFETLWKCSRFRLINRFACNYNRDYKNEKLMSAVKVVVRHKYKITDAQMWIDMVNMLIVDNKDIHNPKYVCPDNLKKAHDKLLPHHNRYANRYKMVDRYVAENGWEEKYVSWKKKFYNMVITNGKITLKVLRTVGDFKKEAIAMHHCLYSCKYFMYPYSLIMSARIKGKRVETVEVDLANYEVKQCYGACDNFTPYHNEIIKLVTNNMDIIRQYNLGKTKNKIAI